MSDEMFLTGQLLVAMPTMTDPRFNQSVIYMCAHSSEGAMGVIVNRPVTKPRFDDLLKQLNILPNPPSRQIALCAGGPVDSGRGFVLHSAEWSSPASMVVDEAHKLTASLDILQAIAEGGGPEHCLLALGYAGWDAGQLDHEIRQNAWLNVPADEAMIFGTDHGGKWRQALAKLKIDPAFFSSQAGRA
ncbi:MAG: hypothetical protein B7Z78_00115 [Rhodospirillales bacterium 20-60-12]|nr:MAG: hypothetical protein B7Z78_00115 [Rhodospirillales bacterium 20-60-12]HQT66474.1 YqgE/AlgH family protein [Acetobacteraceae bacterium]